MKFMLGGEDGLAYLERMTYDGAIGIFYDTTLGGIGAYLIFGAVAILSIIGLCTILKWIFVGRKSQKKKW